MNCKRHLREAVALRIAPWLDPTPGHVERERLIETRQRLAEKAGFLEGVIKREGVTLTERDELLLESYKP